MRLTGAIFTLLIAGLNLFGQQSFSVSEDSYVRGGNYAQTNYGNETEIVIKSAPGFPEFTRKSYLKFDLSDWEKQWIGSAKLSLYAEDVSSSFYITASTTNDQWSEQTITWINAPFVEQSIDSVEITAENRSYEIDITSAFFKESFGDEILTLVIEDKAVQDELAIFRSREAGEFIPQIILSSQADTIVEAPVFLSILLESENKILLNWEDQTNNETGFIIERKINDETFQPIDTVIFNTETYTDTEVETGNVYYYRINALNPFINSAYSDIKEIDLTAINVPPSVDTFSGMSISSGKIRLEWSFSEGSIGFIISRKYNSDFEVIDTISGNRAVFIDSTLSPSTIYSYFIQAYNFLGSSIPSDTIEVLTADPVTYYFDAMQGNDDNPVNSMETPWKSLSRLNQLSYGPGDSILLRAGASWEGQIVLSNSGTEGYPIVLGSYGEGEKPVLDGVGAAGPVITVKDAGFWHIYDIEITNNSETQASRLGVLITANGGEYQHFRLKNLYIHDIFGRYTFEMIGKNTGGIGIIGENDTRYDDILIEDCEISDIVRVGIFTNGNPGVRGDRPITNLVIRNNVVRRCAGDGMIIRYAHRPLIENNIAIENHNASEELVKYGVAIWVRSTDEATIQYNEVSDTKGSMDGQAFDADLDAYRTLVQYNYSRNNEGGFMLVYGSSKDAIVRYNISQNDGVEGKHILDFPIWTKPRGSGIIHNNVFYIGPGNDAVLVDEALTTAKLYNNIVINEGGGELFIPSEGQTAEFSNNCLFGYSGSLTVVNKNPVEGDPELIAPGTGSEGFLSLEGYKISEESPCLGSGLSKSEMNGNYWLEEDHLVDFFGNLVYEENMDVGAHQLSGALNMESIENKNEIIFRAYPVPFNEELYLDIKLPESQEILIKLYDLDGREIDTLFVGKIDPVQNKINLKFDQISEQILPGVYLLRLFYSDSETGFTRIIIKK